MTKKYNFFYFDTYLKLKSGDAQRIATLGIGGTMRIASAT